MNHTNNKQKTRMRKKWRQRLEAVGMDHSHFVDEDWLLSPSVEEEEESVGAFIMVGGLSRATELYFS